MTKNVPPAATTARLRITREGFDAELGRGKAAWLLALGLVVVMVTLAMVAARWIPGSGASAERGDGPIHVNPGSRGRASALR